MESSKAGYESLEKELNQKNDIINDLNQEIYSLKLQLNLKTVSEAEVKQDLEMLQAEMVSEAKKTSLEFENKMSSLHDDYNKKIRELETEIENQILGNEKLKAEAQEMLEKQMNNKHHKEMEKMQQQLDSTFDELLLVTNKCSELESRLESLRLYNASVERELVEEKDRHCHIRNQHELLKDNFNSLKEQLEVTQGDLQGARLELKSQKCTENVGGDNNAAGNSIFAEVEDIRVHAIEALKKANEKTALAEKNLAAAEFHNNVLKMKNHSLATTFNELRGREYKFKSLDDDVAAAHEATVTCLQKRIELLEAQIQMAEKKEIPPDTPFEWFLRQQEVYRENECQLERKIRQLFFDKSIILKNRMRETFEATRTQAENVMLKGEIEHLKAKVEEVSKKLSSENESTETGNSEDLPENCLPSFMIKKEKKTVNFSDVVQASIDAVNQLNSVQL